MESKTTDMTKDFGLSSNIRGDKTGEIRLITSAGISWLPKSAIDSTNHLLSKYKILMSKVTAEHAGEPDKKGQFKIISRTEIIGPNDVCTDSYLIVGASESKFVVENEYKYIQTRFLRFLLMQSVSSINLSSEKFQFIPLQDFTSNSDIDWSKSISEIDSFLCKIRTFRRRDSLYRINYKGNVKTNICKLVGANITATINFIMK